MLFVNIHRAQPRAFVLVIPFTEMQPLPTTNSFYYICFSIMFFWILYSSCIYLIKISLMIEFLKRIWFYSLTFLSLKCIGCYIENSWKNNRLLCEWYIDQHLKGNIWKISIFQCKSLLYMYFSEMHLIIIFLTMVKVKISFDITSRKIDSIEISCRQN